MLVDQATIIVRSGKGGDGHVSFRREKYVPKGGPDGGDGGDGGSVYLVATPGVDTLLDFSGRHHWHAQDGRPGGSRQCFGASGSDLEIQVPPGTLVYDAESGDRISDLEAAGQRIIVARGGRGGYGNEHFKSATNQAPRQYTPGEPAQERTLQLELKLIADIGLIGKPNAGKSTLLSRVSQARPKIADYPFTTLQPNLGIAELSGYRRLVIADIPGLIEGASQGHGLGNRFLRHIERTRCLVHVIGVDPLWTNQEPADHEQQLLRDYHTIHEELASYSKELVNKPRIILLNKIDLLPHQEAAKALLDRLQQGLDLRPVACSAVTGAGIPEMLEACWSMARGTGQTQRS